MLSANRTKNPWQFCLFPRGRKRKGRQCETDSHNRGLTMRSRPNSVVPNEKHVVADSVQCDTVNRRLFNTWPVMLMWINTEGSTTPHVLLVIARSSPVDGSLSVNFMIDRVSRIPSVRGWQFRFETCYCCGLLPGDNSSVWSIAKKKWKECTVGRGSLGPSVHSYRNRGEELRGGD